LIFTTCRAIIALRGDFMTKKKQEKAIIAGNLDPKHWVQKSDPLVLMRTVPFSLGELKILDTYISRINAADDTRRTVIFTKEEYEGLMGLTCVDYRTLKNNTKGLLGKVVELEMPDKEYLQFVLFEQARYHKDEYGKPIIELTCTSLAKDLFFCIGKYHYFKYALENVINLTRKASYLLYLYILTNRFRREWDLSLEELRDDVLDCKGKKTYKEFKEFKKSVLEPAAKEINAKTDCHFKYQVIKRGRSVSKIHFTIITFADRVKALEDQSEDGAEQLSFTDTYSDYDEAPEEAETINYGSELGDLLGETCFNEFSPEQIRVIQDLVLQYVGHDYIKCSDYLTHKLNITNAYCKRKDTESRYKYLLVMINNDIKDPDNAL